MRNDKPAKVPLLKDLKANRDLYLMMLPFFLLFFLIVFVLIIRVRGVNHVDPFLLIVFIAHNLCVICFREQK